MKAKKSYEGLIKEHEQKLAEYKENPEAHDNQGTLKNAKPEDKPKIIKGRIKAIQNQIQSQKNEFEKISKQLENQ